MFCHWSCGQSQNKSTNHHRWLWFFRDLVFILCLQFTHKIGDRNKSIDLLKIKYWCFFYLKFSYYYYSGPSMNTQFSWERLELFRVSIHCQVISRVIINSPYESLKFSYSIFNWSVMFCCYCERDKGIQSRRQLLYNTYLIWLCVLFIDNFCAIFRIWRLEFKSDTRNNYTMKKVLNSSKVFTRSFFSHSCTAVWWVS